MHKFIYWIGVYSICVAIHEIGYATTHELRKLMDSKSTDKKKGPIGIKPEPAKKPLNKIGFGERD